MRVVIVLCAMLAGCQSVPPVVVPDDLRSCQAPVPSPVPPAKTRRDIMTVADWGNRTTVALEIADRRLMECDARRAEAVGLLERSR
jgi:hypothetical protein